MDLGWKLTDKGTCRRSAGVAGCSKGFTVHDLLHWVVTLLLCEAVPQYACVESRIGEPRGPSVKVQGSKRTASKISVWKEFDF